MVIWRIDYSLNVMAHGDAREGKWRGNWRMEWVASTLHTTSKHGVSSITTADAHTSAASSRLNWRPCRFKWTRPFRWKTKSGFCACGVPSHFKHSLPSTNTVNRFVYVTRHCNYCCKVGTESINMSQMTGKVLAYELKGRGGFSLTEPQSGYDFRASLRWHPFPPPSHYPTRSFKVVCCKQQNKRALPWECILGYFSRRLLGFCHRTFNIDIQGEQCIFNFYFASPSEASAGPKGSGRLMLPEFLDNPHIQVVRL